MGLPTITVIGNMKRIETKIIASGKTVTKFQIECVDKDKNGKWTNLYLVGECWEQAATFVSQYFKEGSPAIVTGKLYTNVYEKTDGTKVYENKLLFPNVSFAPKDKSEAQTVQAQPVAQQYMANTPAPTYAQPQQQVQQQMPQPGLPIENEIIPFS